MLAKIWAIAYKEVYLTFTDRSLLLIMLATPLALASIIGFAFSGFIGGQGSDVSVSDITLAIVNLDQGMTTGDQTLNQGQIFIDLLVPDGADDPDNALHTLTDAAALPDAASARAGVADGTYAAAIIIPADFTQRITVSQAQPELQPVALEVVTSPAAPVSGNIASSIAGGIADQIAVGSVAVASTIGALTERAFSNPAFGLQFAAASSSGAFAPDFSAAFAPASAPITIEQQTVTGAVAGFNPLVSFGSAQALFFMMFTALGSANSLMEEKRGGTLQRQLVSPTPRMAILLGKMLGTWVTCVVQVTLLILALTLVGSLIAGELQFIWGNNIFLIVLVILLASLAAGGVGALVAAIVRTPEQGNIVGSVIALLFGLFSGAFFSLDAIPGADILSRLTVNYWGVEAFTRLAQGQTDIGLNLLVLVILGGVFFAVGLFVFDRRLNV
ncbi:MAG: ABC transporter permease [Chloroflexota bacterium]|nr:ABC transporter permease [Chloroflexota bacterium]